jgi:DNA-binding LacI/PurR family transcriptional regulator
MKDIADKCHVSVATVSKAINDHKDISEETRRKIKQTASDMGYYPNSAARALKTNRSYNIGVLLNDESHTGLTHEYFSEVLEGLKVEAECKGYDITFINTHNKRMTYYDHCKYRNLDGVIIACADFSDPEVLEVVNGSIPTVTIDYVFNNCTSVVSDNVKGMRELVLYVYQMGHRKIAYIHGDDKSEVTKERLASFYKTLDELDVEVPDEYVKSSEYLNSFKAEALTYELLGLKNPPTCILYPDDLSYSGGSNAVKALKLKIPQDISMVGYDGIKLSQMLNPILTTYKQDSYAIGKKAAKELIECIDNPKITFVKRIVVDGTVLPGETVRNLTNEKYT